MNIKKKEIKKVITSFNNFCIKCVTYLLFVYIHILHLSYMFPKHFRFQLGNRKCRRYFIYPYIYLGDDNVT